MSEESGETRGPEIQTSPGSGSDAGADVRLGSGERWIETREGGWFFVNAVLAAPALIVAFPLLVGGALRSLGVLEGRSRFFDTIPLIAAYVVPYAGWLAILPLWLTWRSLRWRPPPPARLTLWLFAAVHLAVIGYAAWWWAFSRSFPAVS